MIKVNKATGQLWALFTLIFIDSLNYFLVIPVFRRLFFSDANILDPATPISTRDLLFGIATLLSPLAFIIFSPIIGHLSDKFGRKKILLACLIIAAFGYIIPIVGIAEGQIWLILIGRFISGASSGSQPVAQAAVTDLTTGKEKALYLAVIGFAMTLAMTLGPLIGSLLSDSTLISWFSVTTPYWVGIVLSVLNIFLLLIFLRDTPTTIKRKTKFNEIRVILKDSKLLLLFIVFFLLELAWSQYYQVLFLYMPKMFGYNVNKVAIFTTYIGIWMSLGLTVFYRLFIARFTLINFFYISLTLAAIGFLGCSLGTEAYWQWAFVILVAVFTGTTYACLLALLSNHATREHQGLVLGITSTLLGLAWTITAYSSATLIQHTTELPLYFSTCSILLAVGIAFYSRALKAD